MRRSRVQSLSRPCSSSCDCAFRISARCTAPNDLNRQASSMSYESLLKANMSNNRYSSHFSVGQFCYASNRLNYLLNRVGNHFRLVQLNMMAAVGGDDLFAVARKIEQV